MSIATPERALDLETICQSLADQARAAALQMSLVSGEAKDAWLRDAARSIRQSATELIAANEQDLAQAPSYGLTDAQVDRLRLTTSRIEAIAEGLEVVATLPDPVGEVVEASRRPNGLEISRVRGPLGVLFMIYESRPNVTVDASALAVKSANAIILRGGKEAYHSNQALFTNLQGLLAKHGLPDYAVQMVPTIEREAVGHLLKMEDQIDLVIPRGGASLIRRVVAESTMPVLKHYDGNCHVYLDSHACPVMAERILVNAKTQRVGVCNAAETLLVHREIADRILPGLAETLRGLGVELRGDQAARQIVPQMQPAQTSDWDTEYLAPILAVGLVETLDEAIAHINRHGSRHTDAIVTENLANARRFTLAVDSACVLVNASTRFNDGSQLGLGAEIGISTDKLHARGPCGLRELTTAKWVVYGNGHIR